VLMDPDDGERIAGLIDFGDLVQAPVVADPAIAAAYQCLGSSDPVQVIATFAADYHSRLPLTPLEIDVFGDLAVSRLVQSFTISNWRAAIHPDNRDYILLHTAPEERTLQSLEEVPPEALSAAVAAACGRGAADD